MCRRHLASRFIGYLLDIRPNLGQTRSDFLQEAARRRLGWPGPLAVDAALLRGRAALAGLGSFESAELIRSQREARDARDQRR